MHESKAPLPKLRTVPLPISSKKDRPAHGGRFGHRRDHAADAKPDPAWGLVAHYVDGQLLLKPDENRVYTALYRPLVFKNGTVCVTVKSPLEVTNVEDILSGGLAFWASDYKNYYAAAIFPNGTFGVFRKVNDEWATVVPRTMSDTIKKGIGAVNELQVVLNNRAADHCRNEARSPPSSPTWRALAPIAGGTV